MAENGQEKAKTGSRDLENLSIVEVEGILFPTLFERRRPMAEKIDLFRKMPMRDDDVILCAYAKSGTHWLWEVGCMLLAGKAEYEKRTKEHVMMEASDVEDVQDLPSPRLLNTHLPPRMLPNEVKSGKVKLVHVYRNPKDILCSLHFHMVQEVKDMTPQDTFNMFMSDRCVGGNYFKYLKEMDAFIKDNPQVPVFNMSFEQMKADSVGTVEKLAKFLGINADPQFCRDVADACSFQKLKEADSSKDKPDFLKKYKMQMYRKGQVGDWKNHVTVAQSEAIDAAMEQLKECNFQFLYTL